MRACSAFLCAIFALALVGCDDSGGPSGLPADGQTLDAIEDTAGGGGDTSPGGEDTGPGGEDTDPGGEDTDPGGEDTDPGGEDTDPGPDGADDTQDDGGDTISCSDACATAGSKQCDGAGVQTCGDHDGDGCLEWSEAVACEGGATCSDGNCTVGCTDACSTVGAKKCEGDSVVVCGDHDEDPCLEWSAPEACGEGLTCSSGNCASECSDECTTIGAKQCDGDGVQTCGDHDDDGCLEWSASEACGAGETCSGGNCAVGCSDECTTAGAKNCQGGGVATCDDHDDDGCLEWSNPSTCPEGETCSGGACSSTCTNECTVDGATKCQGNGVQTCGDYDADECLEWGTPVPCEGDLICSSGVCGETCTNECTTDGATTCEGNGVKVCGDFDADECLEWGTVTPCAGSQSCSNGECTTTCVDECATVGATVCQANGVATCGNHDADACLEWGTPVPCEGDQTCSSGVCTDECADECDTDGESRCEGSSVVTCGDFDDDGCLEYGTPLFCALGEACVEETATCEPVSGDLTCAEVNSCINACGDDGECAVGCLNEGTEGAQDEFLDFNDCAGLHACEDGLCLGNFCSMEIASCFYEGTGEATCGEIFDCTAECEQGDSACVTACIESGSLEAQGARERALQCLGTVCPEFGEACVDEALALGGACSVAWASCVAPDEEGLDCFGVADCLGTCGAEDTECQQGCVDEASFVGATEWFALMACDEQSGCPDLACLGSACAFEYAECNGTAVGSASCGDLWTCFESCAEGDPSCGQACFDGGSYLAQMVWIELNTCFLSACPDQEDEACLDQAAQGACANVLSACSVQ